MLKLVLLSWTSRTDDILSSLDVAMFPNMTIRLPFFSVSGTEPLEVYMKPEALARWIL